MEHLPEILNRFREKFVIKSYAGTGILRYTDADKFELFITSELTTLIEKQRKEIKGLNYKDGQWKHVSDKEEYKQGFEEAKHQVLSLKSLQ